MQIHKIEKITIKLSDFNFSQNKENGKQTSELKYTHKHT